jgi:short-subunit dehydrogenase
MAPVIGTALVTGASSGIGLDLSRLLARDGARLVMTARHEERLRRAAGWIRSEAPTAEIFAAPADLARPGSAAALHAWVAREVGPVDFLVNNAGVGTTGRFADGDAAAEADLLQLNIVSLVELTRPCLAGMVARRRGRILNVASIAAFLPGPMMAVYYASKAFVLSFSEAIAEETRGSGVTVTALCPGPTITGFQRRAGIERGRFLRAPWLMQSGPVAAAGYRGALEGRRVVVPGFANWITVQVLRILPRAAVASLARRAHDASPSAEPGEGPPPGAPRI